jgi:hypothetical protein
MLEVSKLAGSLPGAHGSPRASGERSLAQGSDNASKSQETKGIEKLSKVARRKKCVICRGTRIDVTVDFSPDAT